MRYRSHNFARRSFQSDVYETIILDFVEEEQRIMNGAMFARLFKLQNLADMLNFLIAGCTSTVFGHDRFECLGV